MADIGQMFLRVELAPEDRGCHRFLHAENKNDEPKEYEFTRHCFGNAGSPAVAIFVLQNHARKYEKQFPRAVQTLTKATHVDDSLDSYQSVEEAIETAKDIIHITSEAKLPWRKILSNKPEVMNALPTEDWTKGIELVGNNQRMKFSTKKSSWSSVRPK